MSLPSTSGNPMQQFDHIILGAGCAGLSLAVRMAAEPRLGQQKILVIDKAPKAGNDRTWCFWEKQPGYFEHLVHHSWQQLWVKHPQGALPLQLDGYAYKMIRSIDFYKHGMQQLAAAPNVQLHYGNVQSVDAANGIITTGGGTFKATHIFSSVLLQEPVMQPDEFYLLQHFRGWFIETEEDVFDEAAADLMNFRVSQEHGCAFMYVLPLSKRKALVEYTLFTEEVLTNEQYDAGLQQFMQDELKLHSFHISEVENGIIPMTNLRFPAQEGCVTYIGTAGGRTKASTGYTFQHIQQHSEQLVKALLNNQSTALPMQQRFHFYDSVLLQILHERKLPGADVFFQLFQRNPAARVLRFLDNQTSLWQELRLMNTTPWKYFVPAALQQLRHLRRKTG
ncbi:lycopene cyclase family protein [Phnomibacter sp.]|uniref:lycopene cyclase family protein n=1 Tax=Phnomibacter sp. TaxID=2836217 RepID=UPI002FDECE47